MWNSIKRLLAALRSSIAGLGTATVSLFEEFMARIAEIRSMPMRAVRDGVPRMTAAQDATRQIIAEPAHAPAASPVEAPEPSERSTERVTELGALVRLACERLLVDMPISDLRLDGQHELFLLSLTTEELRCVHKGTDLDVGRHVLGTPMLQALGGSMMRTPDAERDGPTAEFMAAIRADRAQRRQATYVDNLVQAEIDAYYEREEEEELEPTAPRP
ncbi:MULTISPECIES: hypothetical protein [unclassified Aureimonas]|uniref:hypothetical protein n=1 Tax=unclassified Aureimonas TaxID=2615206 RepID=UPI0006FEA80B|nr:MULTISPECIES: hypothetical protein [unclassified Aureimonas]KQT61199.1 hypothetical protein ASG62_24140 [Aureimonas sp. Leaf427]KQT62968.1 hypothetical protein ASG54_23085 [Aureimonas sp. Leaf460]